MNKLYSAIIGLGMYAGLFGQDGEKITNFCMNTNDSYLVGYSVDSTYVVGFYDMNFDNKVDLAAAYKIQKYFINEQGKKTVMTSPCAKAIQFDSDGNGSLETLLLDTDDDAIFDSTTVLK